MRLWLLGLLMLTLVACKGEGGQSNHPDRLQAAATTTMITDLVREIGGEHVEVSGIMKPGGDPHLYQPTPADAQLVARSQIVFVNGLHLEGWIDRLVENAGGERPVVVVSKGIEAQADPFKKGYPDPHIWFNVGHWVTAAENVRDGLIKADPAHQAAYEKEAARYIRELRTLDQWVKAEVNRLPENRRHLITSHDAFNYFGKAYGFQVKGVQGISTESEAGARDVAEIVDHIRRHRIPAIFVETSVNPQLIEQISRETGAKIGGTLYSDSLGPQDSPASTYVGMVKENVRMIVEALHE